MSTPLNDAPLDPPAAGSARIVLTAAPAGEAEALAQRLVEGRLAACVNLVPGVRSLYRWRGAVQNEPETLLLIKTRDARLDALESRLMALHPYDVPELLVLTPEAGAAAYLAWLAAETASEADPGA